MRIKNYGNPTPSRWRKLGDALLAVSTTLTTFAVVDEWAKWLTLTIILTGVLGKFLTNFFGNDLP